MCYLVREPLAEPEPGRATPSPGSRRLQPRRAAIAAMLVGGLALAAYVAPSSEPNPAQASNAGTAAAASVKAAPAPLATDAARGALPADDGVPTSTDVSRASYGMGHCEHGL